MEGTTLVEFQIDPSSVFLAGHAERLFGDSNLSGLGWTYEVSTGGLLVMVESVAADEAAKPANLCSFSPA